MLWKSRVVYTVWSIKAMFDAWIPEWSLIWEGLPCRHYQRKLDDCVDSNQLDGLISLFIHAHLPYWAAHRLWNTFNVNSYVRPASESIVQHRSLSNLNMEDWPTYKKRRNVGQIILFSCHCSTCSYAATMKVWLPRLDKQRFLGGLISKLRASPDPVDESEWGGS